MAHMNFNNNVMQDRFPRFSKAEVTAPAEVEVNGKLLRIWHYSQLNGLAVSILRQRVFAIRDALGDANCPEIPSMQREDMVRWILHVQGMLTGEGMSPGRQISAVPKHLIKQDKEHPISPRREAAHSDARGYFPFGPKHIGVRDHYHDLLMHEKEYTEAPVEGIESLRPGGEGRRHIPCPDHMMNEGIADVGEEGIETLRPGGEGKRHIYCEDHLVPGGEGPLIPRGIETLKAGGEGKRHINVIDHMVNDGVAIPHEKGLFGDPTIGGERKRHLAAEDHMMNMGIADVQIEKNETEAGHGHGRRHVDQFMGPRNTYKDTKPVYQSTWKLDPSRLQGSSMIC